MANKYKIIAMDFDGTLLNDLKMISNKNYETLKRLKKRGYIIIGATARSLESAKKVSDISIFDYLILNNGSFVFDVEKREGKDIDLIDKSICLELPTKFENAQIDFCTGYNYFKYRNTKEEYLLIIS